MRTVLVLTGLAIVTGSGITAASLAQTGRGKAPAASPRPAAETATYWMSADTVTGLPAMAAGMMQGMPAPGAAPQQAQPSSPRVGSMLGGLLRRALPGRGRSERSGTGAAQAPAQPASEPLQHNLELRLGSSTRATGTPSAEHVVPAALGVGPSLPLLSPEPGGPPAARPGTMQQFERPRGRILIYWGCGERARPGQPVTIDLSRMSPGQLPPAFASGSVLRSDSPPDSSRFASYGEWPNRQSSQTVPASGSLVGDHVVRGNYSPDIRFSLGQSQDFLQPLRLNSNSAAPSGAVPLTWTAVPNATGYLATVMGGGRDETMVIWTSSESQLFAMGTGDYLTPADAARLVASRVLLSPSTTQCTVPAEVARAAEGAMLMMTAFGPETNIAQPRPSNAAGNWRPQWTVKLRTRSSHMNMLGQDMAAMMRSQ